MGELIDLTGKRFGRLVVIEREGSYTSPSYYSAPLWRCRCDCGTECIIAGKSLRYGKTRSCGCLRSEVSKARHERARQRKETSS